MNVNVTVGDVLITSGEVSSDELIVGVDGQDFQYDAAAQGFLPLEAEQGTEAAPKQRAALKSAPAEQETEGEVDGFMRLHVQEDGVMRIIMPGMAPEAAVEEPEAEAAEAEAQDEQPEAAVADGYHRLYFDNDNLMRISMAA